MKYKLSKDGKKLLSIDKILKTLILPDSVEIIDNFSFYCTNIEKIVAPNVKIIGDGAFKNCSHLYCIEAPNVTQINIEAFYNSSIKILDMPNVEIIDEYAFTSCGLLERVNLPKVEYISYDTFKNCSKLMYINIPNVTDIRKSALLGCSNLIYLNSKLSKEQLISAFTREEYYIDFIIKSRDCKIDSLIIL